MKIWTAHVRDGRRPVLVREKFSWAGFVFGPLWLLLHRVWIAGIIALAADIAIAAARIDTAGFVLGFGMSWLIGLFGNDLRRWSLARRGYALAEVIAERDADAALARLLTHRPELVPAAML